MRIDKDATPGRQKRRQAWLSRNFRKQQCVICGIDDAGDRGSALVAAEAVALEAALVDVRSAAYDKRNSPRASRTRNRLRNRYGLWLSCAHECSIIG
jgi:hypothetical protein